MSGTAPLKVNFFDRSIGDVAKWSWDFNLDGAIDATAQNPSYTYSNAGTYNVSLTIFGPDGSDSVTKNTLIIVFEPPPKARFQPRKQQGTAPLTVGFIDQSEGIVTGWEWDFENDGKPDSFEQNPTHTYNEPGKYTVRLKVTGPGGASTHTIIDLIFVTAPPPKPN
jgi:PKD repeat protein